MKPLDKVNKTIKNLVEQVNEIEQYNVDADFNTRGGGYANSDCIVANIKVYDWLDTDDVDAIINKVNYFQGFKTQIEEEFCNDDRLSSIYNHVCENEVRYLKEKYEELVHLNDYRERARVYAIYRAGNLTPSSQKYYTFYKTYKNEYDKFLKRKHNTHKDYFKWLYKNHKAEIDERDRLESFERECWQYGRSGGWLSICKRDELEDLEFESEHFYINHNFIDLLDIEDNDSFNKLLTEEVEVYGTKNKNVLIKELKTFIAEWEQKKTDIEVTLNEIEEGTKYFKDCLLSQLEHEIEQFLEDLNVDFSNVTISVKENEILTSLGVTVKKDEFIKAYNENKAVFSTLLNTGDVAPIKMKVGAYMVQYAKKIENDILIKAGCHKFSLNNISKALETV